MENINFTKFPNESILLDIELDLEPWELVLKALKKSINDRYLHNQIKIKNINDLKKNSRLIINGFVVQFVIQEFIDDEIDIPIESWFRKSNSPQLILPAYVNQENNIVYFPGVLTSDEFVKLYPNNIFEKKDIRLSLSKFVGGIDLLFNYVLLLKDNSLSKNTFIENSSINLSSIIKVSTAITITAISMIFIPKGFNSKLAINISNLKGQNYIIAINLRRFNESINDSNFSKFCVFSPQFNKNLSENIVFQYSSINKPYIFHKTELNEIKLYKNNKLIWTKTATKGNSIKGIFAWPSEPIENKNIYRLLFRPVGTSIGNYKEITFSTNSKKIKDLDKIINLLGDKKDKWINMINKNIKKDPNLSYALLFSEKNPLIKSEDLKNDFIKDINCN